MAASNAVDAAKGTWKVDGWESEGERRRTGGGGWVSVIDLDMGNVVMRSKFETKSNMASSAAAISYKYLLAM